MVDLVNLRNKDDFIDLLTRIILLIKPSSDINKIEILSILYNNVFY